MINDVCLGLECMVGGWTILKTTVYSTINTGSPSAIESGAWGRNSMFHWEILSFLTKAGLFRPYTALFHEPVIPPLGEWFFWASNNVERNPKSRDQVCGYCSDADNRIVYELNACDNPGKVTLELSWATLGISGATTSDLVSRALYEGSYGSQLGGWAPEPHEPEEIRSFRSHIRNLRPWIGGICHLLTSRRLLFLSSWFCASGPVLLWNGYAGYVKFYYRVRPLIHEDGECWGNLFLVERLYAI